MADLWQLPGYDVLELIGFGATGEVWRARETATGETVALKRLRPGADVAAVEALRHEASLLRSLQTPYVVRLRGVVGEGEGTVLVLDHAGGGSLAALLLHRGRLEPGEVVTIAVPLAEALAVAHARGLVHGDVTPSNVLFTADGMPLLADLGVARVVPSPLAAVDGTAEYVDPAVAAGGAPGPASDVWGLAAVCHHLLAGTPPHDGPTVDDVLHAAARGHRAPLGLLAPVTPRPLVDAVESALAADPAARPDAAAFALSLRRAHSATPVRLYGAPGAAAAADAVRPTHRVRDPVPPGQHCAPGRGRARVLVPLAVGSFVLSAAAGLGWRLGQGGEQAPALVPVAAAPAPSVDPATAVSGGPASAPPTAGTPASATAATGRAAEPAPLVTAPPVATPPVTAPGSPVASPSVPAAAAPDWAAVLDGLDAVRAAAFAAGDPQGLTAVYAPGPALTTDRAVLQALVDAGRTARGVRHAVRSVREVSFDGRTARLRIIDVLASYAVLDGSGAVVEQRPARAEAAYEAVVVRTPQGFRLRELRAL